VDIRKASLGIIILSTLWTPLATLATDRNVPADYSTIQAAIDASSNSDVIILATGTYTGEGNQNLTFNGKAVTVRSTDPNDPAVVSATIIDCQASSTSLNRAFNFANRETANTIIEGLTLKNGWQNFGGAIYCDNSSNPTIRKCVITGNKATYYGGAIYCKGSSCPTVTQCTISNNETLPNSDGFGSLDGGAIYCTNDSNLTLSECTVSNNYGLSGGAIYANASQLTITSCTFTDNQSITSGGAITCWSSNSTISHCLFTGNSATSTGGTISCENSSAPTVTNCTFYGNSSPLGPSGGLNCNGSSPIIKNCIFWNNLPDELKIYSGQPTITYSNVRGSYTGKGNINSDPLFANPSAGDFHLKSAGGRWDPTAQNGLGGWVIDTETSPCLDAGDPNSPCTQEPAADGQIIDMGHYGNTPYASKSPGKVLLTTNVTGTNGTISPPSRSYNLGTRVTLTATPNTGYRVLAWHGTDNDPAEGSNTNTVVMTGPKTVSVEFAAAPVQTFTLTASVVNGHGSVIPTSGTYDVNTTVTLTATPDTGYRVKKWTGTADDNKTTNTNTVVMNADKTVTVEFEQVTYKLITDVDGGHGTITPDTDPNSPRECPMGEVVNLTATPDTG